MKKIAFCFLIYDIINHEELWDLFFLNVNKDKYNIYIHYKKNVKLKYFEKYKLKNCIETKYYDVTLVLAQNLMLQEAYKDINNKHFIFLSNSCIPFKCFDHIYNNLNQNFSYFNIFPKSQCFPRCNKALKFIDKSYIQKASQWCILNRKHTKLMLITKNYLKWFNFPESCPDEHGYITNIFYYNLENEIIATYNAISDATTFANWKRSTMGYKYLSNNELKNYNKISQKELLYLLNSKCFFGRKFNRECIGSLINKKYIDFITINCKRNFKKNSEGTNAIILLLIIAINFF